MDNPGSLSEDDKMDMCTFCYAANLRCVFQKSKVKKKEILIIQDYSGVYVFKHDNAILII